MFAFKKGIPAVLIVCTLMLSGCVTIPDAIKGNVAQPQQDLARVLTDPKQFVGQQSRFGGKVVRVVNLDGKTRLEIATQPLDDGARPQLGAPSAGRIYADIPRFVEPTDVTNQYVTVLGTLRGTEKGKIGTLSYDFVVIDVQGFQRWHLTQQVSMPQPVQPWIYYGPTRRHPGYWEPNPFWGISSAPAQVETYLTE